LEPFLKIGVISALRQTAGTTHSAIDFLKNIVSAGEISQATSCSNLAVILSTQLNGIQQQKDAK
jgi:hypothetical protein